MVRITDSVAILKGVGPKKKALLEKLGIVTINDLIHYYPRTYKDMGNIKNIKELDNNENATVRAKIIGSISQIRLNKRMTILKVPIYDNTAKAHAIFFNSLFLKKVFKEDMEFYFHGKVKIINGEIQISHPDYFEIKDNCKEDYLRIKPIYKLTNGITESEIIKLQNQVLIDNTLSINEYIPKIILNKNQISDINYAINNIHFPHSIKGLKVAKYRLVFEELLFLQLGLLFIKKKYVFNQKGIEFKENILLNEFINNLPFKLTKSQTRVITEIINDMKKNNVMNRLLQGDVGSGKTIIALISMYLCFLNGYQSCMMVPTEILAEQHLKTFIDFLKPYNIKIALLSSSVKNKKEVIDKIRNNEINIVIGTHAVIQDNIEFSKLGLVITDEQHRFGVRQRSLLTKKGDSSDVLVMTATPIPRTLSLILFGDLDISIIDELPPGRKYIKTKHISNKEIEKLYAFIKKQINCGRQAYIVCPLIEESDQIDAKSAIELYNNLRTSTFKAYNLGLIHGKLKPKEKDDIMRKFKEGEIDILISTTVIEVGINVPNATIMTIINAERFGLAQLHQLRGRVGRGKNQSYCFLVTDSFSKTIAKRMKIMEESNNGFMISEKDLEIRGPGDFFGTKQHGLPDLKIADLAKHLDILKKSQDDALKIFNNFHTFTKDERNNIINRIKYQFGELFNSFSI